MCRANHSLFDVISDKAWTVSRGIVVILKCTSNSILHNIVQIDGTNEFTFYFAIL